MTTIRDWQKAVGEYADRKGWWEGEMSGVMRNNAELIALMHSELSEALEALRKPPETPHVEGLDPIAEEMADVVIRVLDFCQHRGIDLEEAIEIKMAFNEKRPYKHGGKAF